jgi:H+-transporting ATPase
VTTAAPLAALLVLFSLSVLLAGRSILSLSAPQIQTLVFLTLVFGGQGTVYLARERRHFWASRPSRWMLWSSGVDVAVVSFLAIHGILMAPLAASIVAGLLVTVVLYLFVVDYLKIAIFRRFGVG